MNGAQRFFMFGAAALLSLAGSAQAVVIMNNIGVVPSGQMATGNSLIVADDYEIDGRGGGGDPSPGLDSLSQVQSVSVSMSWSGGDFEPIGYHLRLAGGNVDYGNLPGQPYPNGDVYFDQNLFSASLVFDPTGVIVTFSLPGVAFSPLALNVIEFNVITAPGAATNYFVNTFPEADCFGGPPDDALHVDSFGYHLTSFNAGFRIEGITPAPGAAGLLGVGGLCALRRRR